MQSHDDEFYFDDPSISPTAALFPPDLSIPYDASHLNIPGHRKSLSNPTGDMYGFNSRLPSLSPSSQAASYLTHGSTGNSPHSSASPKSNFSLVGTDDFLFSNSFTSNELDMFLFQNSQTKPSQPLFLPNEYSFNASAGYTQPQPSTFSQRDMYNISQGAATIVDDRRYSVASDAFSVNSMNSTVPMNIAPAQMQMQYQQAQPPTMQPTYVQAYQQWEQPVQTQLQPDLTIPIRRPPPVKPIEAPPVRRVPSKPAESASPEGPAVGKHNKTERRYRQKVQAAQADLRDSIPALRVLYGTSTEEQKATTDLRAQDGTVDGLGEITRPNASAKATILIGARMYIDLLQKRSAMLQRKANELEQFRAALTGDEELARWRADFAAREAQYHVETQAKAELSSDEDSEDDAEEVPRKRARPAPAPRGRPKKVKEDVSGVRVFAAFAMSFSLVPSASTLLRHHNVEVTPGHVLAGKVTPTEVISRLPLITAEHTSRLLARGLPGILVPHPHTLVDWSWRCLVALVLLVLLGPLMARWTREEDSPAGNPLDLVKDSIKLGLKRWIKADEDESAWVVLAAGMLGGSRLHVIIHLHRTAEDAYSLALLALLQSKLPFLRSSRQLWQEVRSRLHEDAPPALKAVLALPFDEAASSLDLLPPTSSPIAAIAEQVTLVHLNDLYSRLFIRLVDATTKTTGSPPPFSVKSLLENLEARHFGATLQAFDREIRSVVEGVPKGSAAHALGLVLIGLWGVFTGPAPAAQAALASALAGEEVKGAGAALGSVSAMLELLYPGSSSNTTVLSSSLPPNALAIDKLALVCIDYIKLLSTAHALNEQGTRLKRLEASQRVQKATSHLRLVLTQASFVGMDDEDELEEEARSFDEAKERLVGVLSVIGRRAAGRASVRDEHDSGVDGDLNEL